jgi:N-acyl-phosphatidylethanolamine-hydrolysing phospholipase D
MIRYNRLLRFFLFSLAALSCSWISIGCNPFVTRFIAKSFESLPDVPDTVSVRIVHPILQNVGLSVLWIGHATCLIQIGDKVFLTDPQFAETAGMISKRKIEPGLMPSSIEKLDYILISHIHFDHLNYGSLSMLPKSATLILPSGAAEYTPEFGFSEYHEMNPWTSREADGVRITAVPVRHFNGRYGFDAGWLHYDTFTGYIIQFQGKTVFFAGDTGYDPEKFKEIGKKFAIDVAFIPIAPIEPHEFMKRVHADPEEALQIFTDVRANVMVPIHHRTFVQGLDSSLTTAQNQLKRLVAERQLENRVCILNVGEQRILMP